MFFSFTRVSRNRKTGPMPVVTASKDTCPATCPLRGAGCYAEHGPLALQWEKCRLTLDELCNRIRRLPKKQLWRYGQAGDLPASVEQIEKLARANGGRPVICYTHHRNFDAIRESRNDPVPDAGVECQRVNQNHPRRIRASGGVDVICDRTTVRHRRR